MKGQKTGFFNRSKDPFLRSERTDFCLFHAFGHIFAIYSKTVQ